MPVPSQAKSTWKKKEARSSALIDSDDDASGPAARKKAPSTTGFNKPHRLSPALSAVVGTDIMSRPQLTKQLWVYIKANGLQDPNDGRNIIPDERLAAAFGRGTFTSTPLVALVLSFLTVRIADNDCALAFPRRLTRL